jgi:murein DD-endopeptidase MepM/ murein hydrolase activator NlpD
MSALVRGSFVVAALVVAALASSACSSDDAASSAPSEHDDAPIAEPTAADPPAAPDLAEAPASSGEADAGHADAASDAGAVAPNVKTYRLPWTKGTSMKLTQDCDDSCCSDHVSSDEYAWDWANGSSFLVRAARGGTITHFKINSTKGCATTACSTDVNMIVVDHGDGTQAIYMHLAGNTAAPGISCGAKVTQGQPLAMAGTTGHSTGIHLHFQVSQVHKAATTCECGTDGKQCATTFNPYPSTWVTGGYHTLPVAFDEWPSASTCNDRRITMPAALSQ